MGGEGPNNGIGKGYVSYLAEQYNALIVSIEHRFYGGSVPFDDFSVNNLQHLTSRQALADAAYLIRHVNTASNYSCSAWFAFGGSYSGALSAWFRVKYPTVIVGALSRYESRHGGLTLNRGGMQGGRHAEAGGTI